MHPLGSRADFVVAQVHSQLLQAQEPGEGRGYGAGPVVASGRGFQNPCFLEATEATDLHSPSREHFGSKNSFPFCLYSNPPHVHEQNSQASSSSEITRQTRAHKQYNCQLQTPHT